MRRETFGEAFQRQVLATAIQVADFFQSLPPGALATLFRGETLPDRGPDSETAMDRLVMAVPVRLFDRTPVPPHRPGRDA